MSTSLVKPEIVAQIGPVSPPFVVAPAYDEIVYSYGFENYNPGTLVPAQAVWSDSIPDATPTGWTAIGTAATLSTASTNTRSAPRALYVASGTGKYGKTVTGLEIGRSYTLGAWFRPASSTLIFSLGVVGEGQQGSNSPLNVYEQRNYTFTATSTTHTVFFEVEGQVRVDDFTLTRNAYYTGGNNGLDGWSSGTVSSSTKRSGTYALSTATAPARAFTGLTVGHQYTLRGWRWSGSAWVLHSETFTAASTSQSRTLPFAGAWVWDDVELVHHVPAVTSGYAPLPVSEGRVALDENYSPYSMATVEVPLSDLNILERLNPRETQRVKITASDAQGGSQRVFDFGLRGRTVNHKAGTVSLELASDEALLMDKRRLGSTPDSTPRTQESSLRGVCNWALSKVGTSLLAGTDDADVTARWSITNVLANPSAEGVLAPWVAYGNCSVFHATTALPGAGVNAVGFNSLAAAFLAVGTHAIGSGPSVTPGKSYVLSGYAQAFGATPLRSIRACVRWLDGAGLPVGPDIEGTAAMMNNSSWVRCSVMGIAPTGASRAEVFFRVYGSTASGQIGYIDAAMFYEGREVVPFFHGATPATSAYTYSWAGNANASASIRKPVGVERVPELFDWRPGQSLDDFLRPLLESAGLRLFCDEQRVWRLIDPTEYEIPGYVVAQSAHNTTEGSDTITRNTDDWATGVQVIFRWTDTEGVQREAFDFAGTDEKVVTVERTSEYPGPGTAVFILNSLTGRGRTQDVTALVDFRATPTNDVSIDLPGTVKQTGKVRRVVFGLKSGLMEVGTRGLIDTPPGSWAAWNPTQTWSAVSPTLAWKDA